MVFLVVLLLMVMRREREREREREDRKARTAKREKGAKKERQVPIHSLTPDRPPLAATTMLYNICTTFDI